MALMLDLPLASPWGPWSEKLWDPMSVQMMAAPWDRQMAPLESVSGHRSDLQWEPMSGTKETEWVPLWVLLASPSGLSMERLLDRMCCVQCSYI